MRIKILPVYATMFGGTVFGRKRLCAGCGRIIQSRYKRCYRCYMALKRANWHDPENLSALEEDDLQHRRNKFYVYVLDTDFGHYIGHSGNLGARLNAHAQGKVFSTASGNPKKIWQSAPLPTRADAARFEAALKSWRDNSREEFQKYTGHAPMPFYNPEASPARPAGGRGGCLGMFVKINIVVLVLALIAMALG